jgi:Xaa-Pro aminopeptidase
LKLAERAFAANLTESFLNTLITEARKEQERFRGFAFETSVAFGVNSANQFYLPPESNSAKITKKNLFTIDFGSQYLDGTTSMARTIHYGRATKEQKRIFTNFLSGIIQLGQHVFPEDMLVSGIDILTKASLWKRKQDHQYFEGTSIGAFLNVEECECPTSMTLSLLQLSPSTAPINLAHPSDDNLFFKDGNFFTVSPSFFKEGDFGIKLRNVFEVVDTGKENFSGAKFLKFRLATLVPFDNRLIELGLLTTREVRRVPT